MQAETIGQRLKKMRQEKGWTVEELAKKIYKKRTTYSEIENDRTDLHLDALLMLSEIFGVSTDYILTGVEAKNRTVAASLGLCNEAIRKLKNQDPDIIHILDYLLTSKTGWDMLCTLWWYISTDYRKELHFYGPDGKPVEVYSWGAFNEDLTGYGSLIGGPIKNRLIAWGNVPAAMDEEHLNRIKGMIASLKDDFNQERERRKQKGGRKHDESED